MGLLDKLSTILKIDFNLKNLKEVHLFSDNKSEKIIYNDNRKIEINIGALDKQEIPKIQEAIKEALSNDAPLILEKQASEVVNDFLLAEASPENQSMLKFFKGKISISDYQILRASLYLRTVFNKNGNVSELKRDIVEKYGERGRNTSNLCSAGYFETLIKPLYEEMSQQPDFQIEKFRSVYEVIVTQYTFAVFISNQMSAEEVEQEVLSKMEINRKYGIKHLNIHGISSDNVEKILKLLNSIQKEFTSPPEIQSGKKFITVKIWF